MPTFHPLLFTLNRPPQHGRIPKSYLWANVNCASVPKCGEQLTAKYAFVPPLNSVSHAITTHTNGHEHGNKKASGYKRNSLPWAGPGNCSGQTPHRPVAGTGIGEDAPHGGEGSRSCLSETRASLLLFVVPHHGAVNLKAHWHNFVARKGGPRGGRRIESRLSALVITKHAARLPWGGATTHGTGGPRIVAR